MDFNSLNNTGRVNNNMRATRPGTGGIVPWVNFGAINEPDGDILPGVSVRGGERSPVNNAWIGATAKPSPSGATPAVQNDPQSYPPGGLNNIGVGTGVDGGYGVASAAAVPQSDPDTAAWYQDQIDQLRGQEGRLDTQMRVGNENILNSYNQARNRLAEQRGVAQRNYGTQTQQNTQGYMNTRNGVLSNTRATANALQRLLGLNGAGNSSAALEQAPYAAGLQGSQNLNEAQQNYSTNMSTLKTNWDDTERQFKNYTSDLDTNRYQQQNGLKSSIAQTRATLLDKIAQADTQRRMALGENYSQAKEARSGYQNQVNSLLDQITGLGRQYANPVMRTGNVSFKAGDMGEYSLGDQAAISNQAGGSGNLDPTFVNLLPQRDEERNRSPLGF